MRGVSGRFGSVVVLLVGVGPCSYTDTDHQKDGFGGGWVPRRSAWWVWAGRVVFAVVVVGLVVYLAVVGLDRADKLASSISLLVGLFALAAPYLLPLPGVSGGEPDRVEDTGDARATGGGQANTGLHTGDVGRAARAARTGDATADGPRSSANTGIQRGPRP